ncbi:FtsL-like putative cell division protein [Mesonia maritima]|uniref:Cytochrome c biogenesis protein ResB n=1 Tax=Mesonia maritima TaxID=1793873 RepID=A0ABU1K9W6_9FLAO|nr:FtsL-like putative cell division protein [Mesonia maritima]MDR6302076.1 cytochrome c biogenesis protein ResB [Mesonia maritima]
MKKGVYDFLKGKFLISDDAMKNWRFILFCTFLAIIMIACSHQAERKVHQIARMNKEVRELRSEFVDTKKRLMQLKMESSITKKMSGTGISPSNVPPQKIIIHR